MKKKQIDGFSILELIVTMTLLSIIVVTISGGIHFGQRVWEADKSSESIDEIETTLSTLKLLFEKTYPAISFVQNSPTAPPQIQFNGKKDDCIFVALSEGAAQWGGLNIVDITTEQTPTGLNLVAKTAIYRTRDGLNPNNNDPRTSVILRDLSYLHFSYFGLGDDQKVANWMDSWFNFPTLPKLIKISIGINRQGRVIEASIVVLLKQG